MNPQDAFDPPIGVAEMLEPGLRRILAPNPSPMTFRGTNTYLIGTSDIAVLDPGPDNAAHLQAILSSLEPGQSVSHILVSHSHLDHSPLARALSRETGARIYAFGRSAEGRSPVMQDLAQQGDLGGGEGIDAHFQPDHRLSDGDQVSGEGWSLQALHTPGHIGNHLCFRWNDACFTGDHVMGWASSLVSPPDGDLTDFMASCRKLAADEWRVFYPGHGDVVTGPNAQLDGLIAHRLEREASILSALVASASDARGLAQRIYTEVPPALLPAAERNVLAHLIDLHQRGLVFCDGPLRVDGVFWCSGT